MSDNRLKGYTYSYQDSCIELYKSYITSHVCSKINTFQWHVVSVTGWDPD